MKDFKKFTYSFTLRFCTRYKLKIVSKPHKAQEIIKYSIENIQ